MSTTTTTHTKQTTEPTLKNGGLTRAEAATRLKKFGENNIFHKHREHALIAFLKKFKSPLLILLIFASVISVALGQIVSGSIIATMIVLSAVLDFANTYHSERVAESLAKKIVTEALVFRDGKKQSIPIRHIVPGDVVSLVAGSVIPADGTLVEGDDLFVNQSALTGESFPISKLPHTGPLSENISTNSTNDSSAVFMGTSVVTGFGVMIVSRTGANAEFGKIALKLAEENPETDFDKGIRKFSYLIMRITFMLVAFVFFANALKGTPLLDSFIFAIAIAVGLTPELLPVIMTVTLSKGSLAMARKHVVVRTLPAIQNIGAMNILATDKTGTLTEDKITLVSCVDIDGKESEEVFGNAYISSIFHTRRTSPLDEAIRNFHPYDTSDFAKVDEIPFDFVRKRDSIVFDRTDNERFVVTKGAPEELLTICSFTRIGEKETPMSDILRKQAIELYNRLSSEGFRVLGIATKEIRKEKRVEYSKEIEHDMIFVGFSAFMDPAKPTAGKAVHNLAALNVEIKIITGDSEILTERICKDIGLKIKGVTSGAEIEKMSDTELERTVGGTTIFARVNPEGKERVINALRRAGNVVGYLGDGINDAPALKAADVGISVNNAVDVAKETADIILLKKSLDVLTDGIKEGRKTFQNTMKYVRMGFSSNFGNMASMSVASAVLPFLPMLPAQILLNNFLYDLSQTSLPTDNVDKDDLLTPASWNLSAIKRYMLLFGLLSSAFDIFTFYILFTVLNLNQSEFQTGWFIESIATQVLVVYFIRTKKLPFIESRPSIALLGTTLGIMGIALITPYLPFADDIGFMPLSSFTLLMIGGTVVAYLIVVEFAKRYYYRSLDIRPHK